MNCRQYYEDLASQFNLNLDIIPVFSHEEKHKQHKCEAHVSWNGTTLSMKLAPISDRVVPSRSFIHESVVQHLKKLLRITQAPPFGGHIFTGDNSMCHPLGDRLIEHSRSPMIKSTILLPIHDNQIQSVFSDKKKIPRSITRTSCAWFGSRTGYAHLQSIYNLNRRTCRSTQTDRQCVVAMGLPNVEFAKSHPNYSKFDCMLAIDGNGYAGNFKTSLHNGQLVVRVGGFSNKTRWSSYEWFEPFLRPNYHFIQTSIDNLQDTLKRVKTMPISHLQAIASNGQNAFEALSNKTSISCYVRNTVEAPIEGKKSNSQD